MDTSGRLPVDAFLSPETRGFLQSLVKQPDLDGSSHRNSVVTGSPPLAVPEITQQRVDITLSLAMTGPCVIEDAMPVPKDITIKIPLVNDSAFFRTLTRDMSSLDALQLKEEAELSANICDLGEVVGRLAPPPQSGEKTDLQPWREIFSLYIDSNIFFSTKEQDQFNRTSAIAQEQMQSFLDKLKGLGISERFQKKGSRIALHHFVAINLSLLKHLKFQELNLTASMKILKSTLLQSPLAILLQIR